MIEINWKKYNLSEICNLSYGKTLPKNAFTPSGYEVWGANGVIGFFNKFSHEYSRVLVSSRGENSGKINISSPKSYITNNSIVCEPKITLSEKFLFYFLSCIPRQKMVSGSAQPQVVINDLKNIPIFLPGNISEQFKIAEILSTVDQAIEDTEAFIAKNQRIKTGFMQDLLIRGIDEKGNIRSEETHEFKDSPLGRIPVGWICKTIDELAVHVGSGVTPTGGESVYSKEGVLFIRSQNVHFNGLIMNDIAFINDDIHKKMIRSEVFENDILLNITGASIGRCCVMPEWNGKANVNQHVCAIRLSESSKSKSYFLKIVLESYIGQQQIKQLNAGGNREGLNYQQVRSFLIPWPNLSSEFDRITSVIEETAFVIENYKESKEKLISLKKGLMQDLLTGKVHVTPLLDKQEG